MSAPYVLMPAMLNQDGSIVALDVDPEWFGRASPAQDQADQDEGTPTGTPYGRPPKDTVANLPFPGLPEEAVGWGSFRESNYRNRSWMLYVGCWQA